MTKQELFEQWQQEQDKQKRIWEVLPDTLAYKTVFGNFIPLLREETFEGFLQTVDNLASANFKYSHYFLNDEELAVIFDYEDPAITIYLPCSQLIEGRVLKEFLNSECEIVLESQPPSQPDWTTKRVLKCTLEEPS